MRVVTAAQMKLIEEESLKYEMTFHRLMENAGSAAAAFIRRTFQIEGLNCMIFCGSGNNGGDGFVAARKLIESGANVLVVLAGGIPKTGAARAMYDTVKLIGMPVLSLEENYEQIMGILEKADIVVDAIYGTGFHGELGPWTKKACEAINDAIAAVVSLDVPTGVECDTGLAAEVAVRADFTVAFDSRKPVHILPAGREYCGVVETVGIGIPEEAYRGVETVCGELETEMVMKMLPARKRDSHKGDYGRLLIVGGCGRYRGAVSLAAMAALRCGVGYVTLASTKPVVDAASAKLHECIYIELPESESGEISAVSAVPLLREGVGKATAVLFGCGAGLGRDSKTLLEYLVRNTKCPLIIDADGINALAANINLLRDARGPVILTPHPGEMSRICGKSAAEVQDDRYGVAMEFSEKHNVIVVLKGHKTVIASPGNTFFTNTTGNAGLAKAGSGDVLAGMIAAFAAEGLPPGKAAAVGAHLHGLAADEAAEELSQYAMLPSDLPLYLARVLRKYDR